MSDYIGRYQIEAELGHGGFGRVFRAYDPTVGRRVAIKTLSSGGDPEILKRFRNEAAAAGRLRHVNIVIIYDFGDHEGSPYLVMELLEGEDLENMIARRRPLSLLQKIDIIAQSASGLHHAHANGIVHRDVKPANIMLQPDGVVKIVDFGVALLTQTTAARITLKGAVIGTLPFMAPEQLLGSGSDALTDIFAFGVTCYKLLTGSHPFDAAEMPGLMYNIVNKSPEPLRSVIPECPEALERAVFKMLAKDRDERYQSVQDIRFDIEPVMIELRQERVNDLLGEARVLIASNQFDSAQAIVRQALDSDPSNRTAREMRDSLQRQIWEKEVRPRIRALIDAGQQELQTRRFESAIVKFESALQLDKSNAELQSLVAHARAALERAHRATRLLDDARHSLARGDATSAHSVVLEALATDPRNIGAAKLRATIEEQLDARERARRLEEGLNQARRLMMLEGFDRAIEGLESLAREHPESTAVRDLLARARVELDEQTRRRQLRACVEQAKTLLRDGQSEEAVERLTEWRAEFPESSELRDLASLATEELDAKKQAGAIAGALSAARALMEEQRFDPALELLRGVLAAYPGASAIRAMVQTVVSAKNEHERKAAAEVTATEAKSLIAEQRFAEALARIGAFSRAYGSATEIEPLRRAADDGLESQRRAMAISKLMADARALVASGRPESATRLLQDATAQYPEHSELMHLLSETRQRWDEQRRAEAISKILTEAETYNRARQFERAIEILDAGLREYSQADRLLRCRQATLASKARYNREELRRKALEHARALREAGRLDQALATIETALGEAGDEAALLELRDQILGEQAAHRRLTEVRSLLDQAKTLLDSGHVISATELLGAATLRFPGEQALAGLKETADARLREQRRADDIAIVIAEARAHTKERRFDAALALLDSGIRKYGSSRELLGARENIAAAKADHERPLAVERLKIRIGELQAAGRIAEALDALATGLRQFNQDPGLLDLTGPLEAEQERLRQQDARERAIEEVERAVRRLIGADQFAEASNAIEQALRQYPDSQKIAGLGSLVQSARERREALAEAHRVEARGDLERALDTVRNRLEAAPDDVEWLALKAKIEAALEQRERARAVRQVLEEATAQLTAGQPDAALELLRPAIARYPGVLELREILSSAEAQVQRAVREREMQATRVEAEALLAEHRYADALALLNRFPGETRFQDLVSAAREQLELRRQLQARENTRTSLLAIEQRVSSTRKSRLARLVAEARQVLAAHASDAELTAIGSRIERQVDALLSAPATPSRLPSGKWIGFAAGAIALIAVSFAVVPRLFRHTEVARKAAAFPLEIHTDPPGAAVTVGDRKCTAPNCRFELPPGEYRIEARLPGYLVARRSVTVTEAPSSVTNLVLEPEPPPPPPEGSERGTLIVRAGVADARVQVDHIPRGLTDARGELRTVIETGRHVIRVEKAGHQTPDEQSVNIGSGRNRPLIFALRPLLARLEIRGAPPGARVRVGGTAARFNGSLLSAVEVPTGDQILQVTDGKTTREIARRFEPGGAVIIDWRDIAPPPATVVSPAPPPPPPVPTAEEKELQAWNRVSNTTDPDQLDTFLRDHPTGPHSEAARARQDELVWARVNTADARSVQAYLQRFPRGAHVADAHKSADDLSWNAVNQSDPQALQAFLDQNPNNRHRSDAQAIVDRLKAERQPVPAPGGTNNRLTQALDANKRGVDLYQRNLVKEAIISFDEAIRIAPKLASAYFNRGAAYYHLGRFDQAASDFERALSIESSYPAAKDMLTDCRLKLSSGVQVVGGQVSAPVLLRPVEPHYTREARKAGLEGVVRVQLVVDTRGQTQQIKVVSKLGMGLDENAMEAVKNMRFTPAAKDGKPVPVMITVEVKFQLPK